MGKLGAGQEYPYLNKRHFYRDLPGSTVVNISPSNAGGAGLIPGWGIKMPHDSWPKNQNINNRSNVVTDSIKTLEMVNIKKKNKYIKIFLKKTHHQKFQWN